MSDYSDSESSSSDNESIEIGQKKTKKPINKNNIDAYNDDDEMSEIDENEEQDNDDVKIGGEDSDLEEGETKEEDESDIDEAVNNESEVENESDYEDDEEEKPQQSKSKTPTKSLKEPTNKKMVPLPNYSDDEDDDEDENYLQKFDNEITKNYIQEYHPECFVHNYEEISQLTKVVKNSDNIIIDPLHKTIPFLTKYEKTRVLGQRAKQIEAGARPFVRVPENVVDGYVISELELQQKRIPFIIRRPLPNGGSEYWNLKDLEII